MNIYIATSLSKASDHNRVRDTLLNGGYHLTYDWTVHGSVKETTTFRLREVASNELRGVLSADVLVVLLPGGHGTHTELGMALGSGMPVILHSTDPCYFEPGPSTNAFYHHESVHHVVSPYEDLSLLLEKLNSLRCIDVMTQL